MSGGGNEWTGKSGWLNQRLAFKTAVQTESPSGGPVTTYSAAFECWGAHRDLKAKEREVFAQETAQALAVFVIRYGAGVPSVKGIITWRGQDWEIMAPPVELGNQQGWQVFAVRKRADG